MKPPPGFSLLELIVSLSLLSIVMAAVMGLTVRTQRGYTQQREIVRAQDNVRVADVFIRTVLRSALANPTSADIATSLVINPDPFGTGDWRSSIRVRGDFNPPDGLLTGDLEDVTLRIRGDTLMVRLRAGGAELPFLHPVRSLRFTYFGPNGDSITTSAGVANAHRVRYVLTAPASGFPGDSVRRETWVYLRNRR
jgi:prepilin-type N-terminal cleavage/methylation domain-containing protein